MTKKKSIFKRLSDVSRTNDRAAFADVQKHVEKYHHGSEAFLNLARSRYSCRSFNSHAVASAKIAKIEEAARLAPTARNQQPVHVWTIQSPEALAKLKEATPYSYDAPVVFMVGCKPEEAWVRRFDGKNGAETDAAIVGTHIMLEAADLELGCVWVGSFDPAKIAELFPETAGWTVTALFPTGHPSAHAAPSENHGRRRPLEEFITRL